MLNKGKPHINFIFKPIQKILHSTLMMKCNNGYLCTRSVKYEISIAKYILTDNNDSYIIYFSCEKITKTIIWFFCHV